MANPTCRACNRPSETIVCAPCLTEASATRILADAALTAGAIRPEEWERIDASPMGEHPRLDGWVAP